LLLLLKRLTLTDDLGIWDELASSVQFRTLWILGHRSWGLNNRTSLQIYQHIIPLALYTFKHSNTAIAISMDVGSIKFDHPTSFWITSSTSIILVYYSNTDGEYCCPSFLSLDDISFCVSLSSDI
jgi:hypothetical protein